MWSVAFYLAKFLVLSQVLTSSQSRWHHDYDDYNDPCEAEQAEPWSYRGENGPMSWGETYPTCYGESQSPIAINGDDVTFDQNLAPLELNNYDIPVSKATVLNNGHTVQVTPGDNVNRTILVNGSVYNLIQLHFHWGHTYSQGSEHELNSRRYGMELHLVHQNSSGQLSVVAVFFQQWHWVFHNELDKIVDELPKIRFKDEQTELSSSLNLEKLVPSNPARFYRYEGSLTTPGCNEGVTWSVIPVPIRVTDKQLLAFRNLYAVRKEELEPQCKLVDNFRPLQPLNGRTIYASRTY